MASNYRVEIRGLKDLIFSFKNYPKIAEPIMQKAVDATVAIFGKNTLKDDPVPWRTGNLLQSFRFQSGRLMARWFPTAYYAPFVHDGTRYIKANHFMSKILSKSEGEINKIFRQAQDMINREIAKSTRI
jgi:hypothetical protein